MCFEVSALNDLRLYNLYALNVISNTNKNIKKWRIPLVFILYQSYKRDKTRFKWKLMIRFLILHISSIMANEANVAEAYYGLIKKCNTRLSWLTKVQISYLQTNATLVMRRACATFVVSTKLNIQTNSTDITMKRTISVNSKDKIYVIIP